MTDDWFVPGVGLPNGNGVAMLRLRPPKTWTRVVLELARTPPSMNDNAIRSHWRGFHTHKKSWEEEIGQLLMLVKVRREGAYRRAIAGCYMRFPTPHRRDPSNYASLVNKALGDALVVHRAIPDDDATRYIWGGVEIEGETGSNRTQIVLFLQPQEG